MFGTRFASSSLPSNTFFVQDVPNTAHDDDNVHNNKPSKKNLKKKKKKKKMMIMVMLTNIHRTNINKLHVSPKCCVSSLASSWRPLLLSVYK